MRTLFFTTSMFAMLASACTPPPDAKTNPTWADVEPILRGQCNHCHGSTAAQTAALGPAVYRLDFYDLEGCGDAAVAMEGMPLAHASASLFTDDLTIPPTGDRPRMPPAPAVALEDWQRDTLLAWAKQPVKGTPPLNNRPPTMAVQKLPVQVNQTLSFTVVADDPDGNSVVGVIRVANAVFRMNRPGSFALNIDASTWPAGSQHITGTLCDGWVQSYFDLGDVTVKR